MCTGYGQLILTIKTKKRLQKNKESIKKSNGHLTVKLTLNVLEIREIKVH